jgi:biopolymer transport protein ExbD
MANRRDAENEINSSSMADIAFLLLIFFLVVTKIDTEKGIPVKLPPWSDIPPPDVEIGDRNAFVVLVNSRDELLVEKEPINIKQLKDKAKKFINNRGRDPELSDSPQKAVISFKGNRGTSYGMYLSVYNELRAAYNELRDEYAQKTYGKAIAEFSEADSTKWEDVKRQYPLRLSEAEPVSF